MTNMCSLTIIVPNSTYYIVRFQRKGIAMGRKETDHSVPSFSMPEEVFQEFEGWWKDKYGSRQAALNEAVKVLMTDRMREVLPEQAANIDSFEMYVGKISDAYRSSLEWSSTADERAKREVSSQLAGMETLAATNERLETEKSRLQEVNADLERKVSDLEKNLKDAEERLAAVEADAKEIDDLRKKCAALTLANAEMRDKHNEEIAKLQEDNFNRILELVKAGVSK